MNSLKNVLKDWHDIDGAQYELARLLGVIDQEKSFQETKHIWWTNDVIGNMMFNLLEALVGAGVLESRTEPDHQYRWKGIETLPAGVRTCCGYSAEENEPCPYCEVLTCPLCGLKRK